MLTRSRSTSIHLPASVLDEIDALADRLPPIPGARISRNAWIVAAIRQALDTARTAPAAASAATQTQNP